MKDVVLETLVAPRCPPAVGAGVSVARHAVVVHHIHAGSQVLPHGI